MPVYDYKCREHGVFNELATMKDHDIPAACPVCQQLSPRIIMVAPQFLDMAREKRNAIEVNERSRHEPKLSTNESREEDAARTRHGCGCRHEQRKSKVFYTAEGNKMFPSMRPWMISH